MPYRFLGRVHATAYATLARLRSETGQGTVEYVAIILLVATIFAAVIGASGNFELHTMISEKIKAAINTVTGGGTLSPTPPKGKG